MSPQTTQDGSISITLADLEVLDCSICYKALSIPIFQCENGHIACSTCIKIRNKCPSCSTPIGYSRCREIEKVWNPSKCHTKTQSMGAKKHSVIA